MKNPWRVVVPTLASLFLGLAAAVWAQPTTTASAAHLTAVAEQAAPVLSVSGKIAAVNKDSFTLAVESLGQAPNSPKAMTCLIDPNTTIDGKLMVGASADVVYRLDKGQNLAVSVRVNP